ncbi:unnamed protein product [Cladocopium goreaui]|uniref:Uncharacterized protein n=1 Tax=Cladocopium goreaui TaxID=2562237 RepID=A0A9P1G3Q1_9DINO|nr:unnamed protein product [Cladocopium goreaui]
MKESVEILSDDEVQGASSRPSGPTERPVAASPPVTVGRPAAAKTPAAPKKKVKKETAGVDGEGRPGDDDGDNTVSAPKVNTKAESKSDAPDEPALKSKAKSKTSDDDDDLLPASKKKAKSKAKSTAKPKVKAKAKSTGKAKGKSTAKSSTKKKPAAAASSLPDESEEGRANTTRADDSEQNPDAAADGGTTGFDASPPSASTAKSRGRGRGNGPIKRPAGRSVEPKGPCSQKAYKYCYHKDQKWGIKFKGHEVMTEACGVEIEKGKPTLDVKQLDMMMQQAASETAAAGGAPASAADGGAAVAASAEVAEGVEEEQPVEEDEVTED